MKLYNILLLLHGEITNQVRLEMVTAAEIQLLRGIHLGNNDAVQDIVHVANTNRSDAAERRRLANKYAPDPFSLDNEVAQQGVVLVNKVFGPEGVPLPQEVPANMMGDMEDYVEETETIEFLDGAAPAENSPTGPKVAAVQEIIEPVTADPFADEGEGVVVVPEPITRRASPLRQRANLEA